jgi:hypothetical protein
MPRDLERQREWRRQRQRRLRIAKYGEEAADLDMRGRHGNHARGEANGRWNHGRLIASNGYVIVRVSEGGFGNGYDYEHRVVVARLLGRPLTSDEQIHHRNGNILDNSPDNLVVEESRSAHAHEHWPCRQRDHLGRFLPSARHVDIRVREMPR